MSPLVPAYPLAVLGGGILLGWRFDRSRLVLSLLVLLLAERALLIPAPAGDAAGEVPRVVGALIALLLPLDLAALSWLPERGLWAAGGRISLVLLALQIAFVALLCQPLFLPLSATLDILLVRPGVDRAAAAGPGRLRARPRRPDGSRGGAAARRSRAARSGR